MKVTHWHKLYKEDFLNLYQGFSQFLANITSKNANKESVQEIYTRYKQLFDSACSLLESYMLYNGLKQDKMLLYIRQTYNMGIITNGQLWINLLFAFRRFEEKKEPQMLPIILNYLRTDKLQIFENLKEYLEKEYLQDIKKNEKK